MDAFTILAEMAGASDLTPDQLAQIRALNVRYYTALLRLRLDATGDPGATAPGTSQGRDALRADLRADVHAVLTRTERAPGGD